MLYLFWIAKYLSRSRGVPSSFYNLIIMNLTNRGTPQYYFPFCQTKTVDHIYHILYFIEKNTHTHTHIYIYTYTLYICILYIWAAVKINCLCLVQKYKLSIFGGGAYRFPVFCSNQHEISLYRWLQVIAFWEGPYRFTWFGAFSQHDWTPLTN